MQCDYFLESYRRILLCSAVCFVIQCGFNFLLCGSNHLIFYVIIFWKAIEQYFHVMLWFLHFWCLDQNMQCAHSLESHLLNSTSYTVLFAL